MNKDADTRPARNRASLETYRSLPFARRRNCAYSNCTFVGSARWDARRLEIVEGWEDSLGRLTKVGVKTGDAMNGEEGSKSRGKWYVGIGTLGRVQRRMSTCT